VRRALYLGKYIPDVSKDFSVFIFGVKFRPKGEVPFFEINDTA